MKRKLAGLMTGFLTCTMLFAAPAYANEQEFQSDKISETLTQVTGSMLQYQTHKMKGEFDVNLNINIYDEVIGNSFLLESEIEADVHDGKYQSTNTLKDLLKELTGHDLDFKVKLFLESDTIYIDHTFSDGWERTALNWDITKYSTAALNDLSRSYELTDEVIGKYLTISDTTLDGIPQYLLTVEMSEEDLKVVSEELTNIIVSIVDLSIYTESGETSEIAKQIFDSMKLEIDFTYAVDKETMLPMSLQVHMSAFTNIVSSRMTASLECLGLYEIYDYGKEVIFPEI